MTEAAAIARETLHRAGPAAERLADAMPEAGVFAKTFEVSLPMSLPIRRPACLSVVVIRVVSALATFANAERTVHQVPSNNLHPCKFMGVILHLFIRGCTGQGPASRAIA